MSLKHSLFLLPTLLASCANGENSGIKYRCDNGQRITAQYLNTPPAPRATINIEGRSYALYQTRSASGARYATEQGLTGETGLIWWTKGDEATLYEMILDHTVNPADYPLITTCRTGPFQGF